MAMTRAPIVIMLREKPIKLMRRKVMSKDTGMEDPTIRLPFISPKNTKSTNIVITIPKRRVSAMVFSDDFITSALS